jgi:hypothetical protein
MFDLSVNADEKAAIEAFQAAIDAVQRVNPHPGNAGTGMRLTNERLAKLLLPLASGTHLGHMLRAHPQLLEHYDPLGRQPRVA